jgi:hypothetical protein
MVPETKETNRVQDAARRFKNNFKWIQVHELREAAVELSVTVNLEAMPSIIVEKQCML